MGNQETPNIILSGNFSPFFFCTFPWKLNEKVNNYYVCEIINDISDKSYFGKLLKKIT